MLGSKLEGSDIIVNANTKSIDATDGNSIIATIKIPKGHNCYLNLDGYLGENHFELSKLPIKKTKNGITTYTIRLCDLENYNIEDLANDEQVFLNFPAVRRRGFANPKILLILGNFYCTVVPTIF